MTKPSARTATGGTIGRYLRLEFLDDHDAVPACDGIDPDVFFPDPGQADNSAPVRLAKRICRHCDVKDACAAWAIPQTGLQGIWGGLTPKQRAYIRRRTPTVTEQEPADVDAR